MSTNFENLAELEAITGVGEQIIPLLGHLGSSRNKHAKWGIKLRVLAGLSGYIHRFLVGGDTLSVILDKTDKEDLGLSGQSVLDLLLNPEPPPPNLQAALPEAEIKYVNSF